MCIRDRYWVMLARHKFVLSLHGNGLDTRRGWEIRVSGAIPVVVPGPLSRVYAAHCIPTVELDGGWRALGHLSSERLHALAADALALHAARQTRRDGEGYLRLAYWQAFVEAGRNGSGAVRHFLQRACAGLPRWRPKPTCAVGGCAEYADDWGGLEHASRRRPMAVESRFGRV